MPVKCFSIGPLETNCYIAYKDNFAVAIDPGGDPKSVVQFLANNKIKLVGICLTHLHFDHLYGVQSLHTATNAPIFSPPDDEFLLENEAGKGGMWGFPRVNEFTASPLTAGEHKLGPITFTALHTPGHTPGSMSLYFADLNAVFSGDVLFYRAIGRADLPGGNHNTLIESIREKLFTLPSETVVYPGHGPESSISDEKNNNPYCGSFVR